MNDQADAPMCEYTHATKSDYHVAVGSRRTGKPVQNTTLVINALCATQTRDETPLWMEEDLILHGDERAILINKMAKYLGIMDLKESVVEGAMNEFVKDNGLYQPYEDDQAPPIFNQRTNPWAKANKSSFKYNGHYFINSPDEYNFGKAMSRRNAPQPETSGTSIAMRTRSRTRSRSEESNRDETLTAEVDVDNEDEDDTPTSPEQGSQTPRQSRTNRGNANRDNVRPHTRTFEGVDFEQCNIKHAPLKRTVSFVANTFAQTPVPANVVSYEKFQENAIADRVIEVDEVVSPPNRPIVRQRRIRIHTFPPGEIKSIMNTPKGQVYVPNLSRRAMHNVVVPRLKLGSVIFAPPGGGKTTFSYRMSTLGVKVLDTGQISRWKFPPIEYTDPKMKGVLGYDLSRYLIVTNNLTYALNAPNALYVLPCKEVYEKRKEYKNRVFPPYYELKRYIQKQCQRPGHTYLETDLQLGSLPWLVNYTCPDYFRVQEIDSLFADVNYAWDSEEYQSNVT